MNALKRSIIIDIDGSFYDNFKKDNKKIIEDIFVNNRLVILFDKVLWRLNSLDLIPNSMAILNLRLWLYSILSFKSFQNIKQLYLSKYQKLLYIDLLSKRDILKQLLRNYEVIFVTNNIHAYKVMNKYLYHLVIYAPNTNSRLNKIQKINETKTIDFIVGNNYIDDILLARKCIIYSIYIGKSSLKNFFKAYESVKSFNEALEILLRGD